MNNLWTEKFRPSTLDGYVFTDANQRAQIEAWIAEKSVPHVLFSGQPGTGKCLGPDEVINIRLDTSQLTEKQQLLIKSFQI